MKRLSFKFKILGIMLLVFILVMIIGLFAYQRFTNIVLKVSNDTKPDMRLLKVKSILNDLTIAETNVKSYNITKDTVYLSDFYNAIRFCESKLLELDSMNENSGISITQKDSLKSYVYQKIAILNEFLLIQDNYNVEDVIEKIRLKIDSNYSQKKIDNKKIDKITETPYGNSKKNIWKKVFGNKNHINKDTVQLMDYESKKSDITKEIHNIKRQEIIVQNNYKQKELELILIDKAITQKIGNIISEIEKSEKEAIFQKTKEAEIAVEKTNIQIIVFCTSAGILLLLMVYTTINYIRHNNRYRKALQKAKSETEELAKIKDRFYANMSHEIRTPMNAISGFADLLAQSKLNSEQKQYIHMLRKSTDHLLYLINDVLDYSKLQSGKLGLESIPFDYKIILKDVKQLLTPLAVENDTDIKLFVSDDNNSIFKGDPYRLKQILFNIISNAIKFTNKGNVTIKAFTINDKIDYITLKIEVSDTGIGMNKAQLDKIFMEFQQADSSISRIYGGTGLGLSIVEKLIKLHRGSIDIQSKPGIGTTVTMEIPYKKSDNLSRVKKSVNNDFLKLKLQSNLKILVVDDEEYNRKLLLAILKKHNAICTEAVNGEVAYKLVKKNYFDIILMDSRMPKLNGIESVKKIRNLPDNIKKQIPVIALTAAVSETDKRKHLNAGMQGFLAKPFKETELIKIINSVLEKRGSINIVKSDTNEDLENINEKKLDLKELRNISKGDNDFYLEMLETFLETTGKEVINMNNCLKEKNWRMLAEYAHKISSPCRHLGANMLYKYLKEIEMKCRNNKDIESIDELINKVNLEYEEISVQIKKELQYGLQQ